MPNPIGRPTQYTSELGDKICEAIAKSNRGLSTICETEGFPSRSTIHQWVIDNKDFSDKYARAREDQADFLAEEMLTIADHSDKDTVIIYDKAGNPIPVEDKEWTNRSRLRVDTRKWISSKLKPKKWGDKIDINSNHSGSINITMDLGEIKPNADKL